MMILSLLLHGVSVFLLEVTVSSPGTEAYLPRALFDPATVIMPSAPVGREVYQTVVMINNGNSPIAYDFQLDHRLV